MRFFGSHSPQVATEEEPEEETAVTRLFAKLEEKLAKNRESMDAACEKAGELEERLTRASMKPPKTEPGTG